jgi:5-methylcytosine-specific restriction endonuclease McrA
VHSFQGTYETQYFTKLLCEGEEELSRFSELFDSRPLKVKRVEFNRLVKAIRLELLRSRGEQCELQIGGVCLGNVDLQVDHLIPLATNVVNKLNGVKAVNGRKVKSHSYGSNHIANLGLACRACNAHKKHRILSAEETRRILSRRLAFTPRQGLNDERCPPCMTSDSL